MSIKKIGLWDLVFMNVSVRYSLDCQIDGLQLRSRVGRHSRMGSFCIHLLRTLCFGMCRTGIYLSS